MAPLAFTQREPPFRSWRRRWRRIWSGRRQMWGRCCQRSSGDTPSLKCVSSYRTWKCYNSSNAMYTSAVDSGRLSERPLRSGARASGRGGRLGDHHLLVSRDRLHFKRPRARTVNHHSQQSAAWCMPRWARAIVLPMQWCLTVHFRRSLSLARQHHEPAVELPRSFGVLQRADLRQFTGDPSYRHYRIIR